MNLGPRCEVMLPNRLQCSNTAMDGMSKCLLHTQLTPETTTVDEQNQNINSNPSEITDNKI